VGAPDVRLQHPNPVLDADPITKHDVLLQLQLGDDLLLDCL
jgi:hypothetical protein